MYYTKSKVVKMRYGNSNTKSGFKVRQCLVGMSSTDAEFTACGNDWTTMYSEDFTALEAPKHNTFVTCEQCLNKIAFFKKV